jgi:hypothetical protein
MTYEDNLTANDSLILSDSSKSVSKPEPNGTTNVTGWCFSNGEYNVA